MDITLLPKFIVVSALIVVFSFVLLMDKATGNIGRSFVFWAFALFTAWCLVSVSWANNFAEAIYSAQKSIAQFAVFSLALFYLWKEKRQEKFIVVASLILGLTAAIIFFSQFEYISFSNRLLLEKIKTFSGHKNLFGSFLFLLFPFCILGIIGFRKHLRLLAIVVSLLVFAILILLQVRAVWLGLLAVVFLSPFLLLLHQKWRKIGIALSIGVILLLFAGYFILKSQVLIPSSHSGHTVLNVDSFTERLKIWQNTLCFWKDIPLLGVGAGNWQFNYPSCGVEGIDVIQYYQVSFQRPHNDFLWILSEQGLIGLILYFLIIILLSGKAFIYLKRKNIKEGDFLKVALLLLFFLGFQVVSIFCFPKERMEHLVFSAVLMAVLYYKTNSPPPRNHTPEKWLLWFFILFGSFNLVTGFYRYTGEWHTRKLLHHKAKGEFTEVLKEGEKAINLFYTVDPSSKPIVSYLGEACLVSGDFQQALKYSEEAFKISPYDFEILSNYGMLLEQAGSFHKAEKLLLEAYRINPFYDPAIYNLITLNYNRGNYINANKWLEKVRYQGEETEYYRLMVLQKLSEENLKPLN
jgi:O-antigen ligase